MGQASATLRDPIKDAVGGDLTSVRLDRTAEQLRVTYELAAPLPRVGTTGIFLAVSNSDSSIALQAVVKWLDGDQIAYFVSDSSSARQKNLNGDVLRNGKKIVATFPIQEFAQLGDLWKWYATTTIEGKDVDSCPDAGDDPLRPKTGRLSSR
jgi:hypothetical protein